MSPEQARGENVDSRSDLFSLGSVIYMMITGHPPITGDSTYAIVRRIGGQEMPSLRSADPSLPIWVDRLVARLHALDPMDRIQSAQELESLLNQSLAHLRNPGEHPLPESLQPKRLLNVNKVQGRLVIALGGAAALCLILYLSNLWSAIKTKPMAESEENQAVEFADGIAGTTEPVSPIESPETISEPEEIGDWDDQLDSVVEDLRRRIKAIESELDEPIN